MGGEDGPRCRESRQCPTTKPLPRYLCMVKMRDLPDGSDARALANRADDLIAEPESAQPQPPDEAQSARPSPPNEAQSATPAAEPEDRSGHPARLVFASFLMLFVELALIRWVTANNVFVTKATNFVLL